MPQLSTISSPPVGAPQLAGRFRGKRWIAPAVGLLLAGAMWFYVEGILIPHQRQEAAQKGRPRGNLSDLYPRWIGARDLLLYGRDPYRQATTIRAQEGYYGRPLDPRRPADPHDQQAFAYPVYVVFLLAPTVRLDFATVQEAFRWILIALTLITAPLWVRVLQWRISRAALLAAVLLTFGSFPAAQGIKLQQLSLLVSPMLAAAMLALAAGVPVIAGVLLALATIKPQIAVPLLAFLAIWSMGNLRRRWPLGAGFLLSLAVLIAAAEVVLPGWIGEFWSAVGDYRRYTGGVSLLVALIGPAAGSVATVLLAGLTAVLSWRTRKAEVHSPEFSLMTALVLAVTVVIIPTWAPYNQLLLLPGVFLLVRDWRRIVRGGRGARLMYVITAALVVWPWLASAALAVGRLFVPAESVQQAWTLPLYTSIPIPVAVAIMLIMYRLQWPESSAHFRLKIAAAEH